MQQFLIILLLSLAGTTYINQYGDDNLVIKSVGSTHAAVL